jgi:serine/threonine protein kinase
MLYMIKKNFFHCDLKSNNILIDSNWRVKLCDFGLAINRLKSKKKGKIKGTPNWMAPEILRGNRFKEASDVYSFGLVLW